MLGSGDTKMNKIQSLPGMSLQFLRRPCTQITAAWCASALKQRNEMLQEPIQMLTRHFAVYVHSPEVHPVLTIWSYPCFTKEEPESEGQRSFRVLLERAQVFYHTHSSGIGDTQGKRRAQEGLQEIVCSVITKGLCSVETMTPFPKAASLYDLAPFHIYEWVLFSQPYSKCIGKRDLVMLHCVPFHALPR